MPEQLLGRIIRACSNPGDLVVDPLRVLVRRRLRLRSLAATSLAWSNRRRLLPVPACGSSGLRKAIHWMARFPREVEMPYAQTEAQRFLTHNGVEVFHIYSNDYVDEGPRTYWYALHPYGSDEDDHGENGFLTSGSADVAVGCYGR